MVIFVFLLLFEELEEFEDCVFVCCGVIFMVVLLLFEEDLLFDVFFCVFLIFRICGVSSFFFF